MSVFIHIMNGREGKIKSTKMTLIDHLQHYKFIWGLVFIKPKSALIKPSSLELLPWKEHAILGFLSMCEKDIRRSHWIKQPLIIRWRLSHCSALWGFQIQVNEYKIAKGLQVVGTKKWGGSTSTQLQKAFGDLFTQARQNCCSGEMLYH